MAELQRIIVYIKINMLTHHLFTHGLRMVFHITGYFRVTGKYIRQTFTDQPTDLMNKGVTQ